MKSFLKSLYSDMADFFRRMWETPLGKISIGVYVGSWVVTFITHPKHPLALTELNCLRMLAVWIGGYAAFMTNVRAFRKERERFNQAVDKFNESHIAVHIQSPRIVFPVPPNNSKN